LREIRVSMFLHAHPPHDCIQKKQTKLGIARPIFEHVSPQLVLVFWFEILPLHQNISLSLAQVTDNQKYGMVEAIAHLINRDYELIGDDFVNLDFIPEGTDTTPIVPALKRVFDAALAGGGAKSINFQVGLILAFLMRLFEDTFSKV